MRTIIFTFTMLISNLCFSQSGVVNDIKDNLFRIMKINDFHKDTFQVKNKEVISFSQNEKIEKIESTEIYPNYKIKHVYTLMYSLVSMYNFIYYELIDDKFTYNSEKSFSLAFGDQKLINFYKNNTCGNPDSEENQEIAAEVITEYNKITELLLSSKP